MRDFIDRLSRKPRYFCEFLLDGDYSLSYKCGTIMDTITYPFRELYKRITNLMYWFPVIWTDKDWDECFLMAIMEHKIRSMAKYFKETQRHVGDDKVVKQMIMCANLLNRLQKDQYCSKEFDEYVKAHPIEWLSTSEDGLTRSQVIISDKDRAQFKKIMDKEDYARKYDLLLLFDCMRVHILRWWS